MLIKYLAKKTWVKYSSSQSMLWRRHTLANIQLRAWQQEPLSYFSWHSRRKSYALLFSLPLSVMSVVWTISSSKLSFKGISSPKFSYISEFKVPTTKLGSYCSLSLWGGCSNDHLSALCMVPLILWHCWRYLHYSWFRRQLEAS